MKGFEGLFSGQEAGKVDRIIALIERLKQIDNADVVKTLGAARDAAIAELKTI
jgi:hypothetical protein